MSNILFLDIDGPICTERAYKAYEQDKARHVLRSWDPIAIKLIDRICLDFDMEVVVSSTWRERYDVPTILQSHGFRSNFHQNCKTPIIPGERYRNVGNRADEITQWIEHHLAKNTDHKVLIVDDNESGDSLENHVKLKNFTIFCDIDNGFSLYNYEESVKKLKKLVFIR